MQSGPFLPPLATALLLLFLVLFPSSLNLVGQTLSGNRELREQIYSKLHEKSKVRAKVLLELMESAGRTSQYRNFERAGGRISARADRATSCNGMRGEEKETDGKQEEATSAFHKVRSPRQAQARGRDEDTHEQEGEEDELAFMIREKDVQDYNQTGVSWKKLDEAAVRGRKETFAHGFVRAMKNRYDAAGEEEVSECVWCGKIFKSLRQRRIHDLKCKKRSESKTASRVVSPSLLRSGSNKKLLPNVDETFFTEKKISEVGLC